MRIVLLTIGLVLVGCLALPLTAAVLDGSATGEDLVLPVYVAATVAVGAGLGVVVLPGGPGRPSTSRRALTGAGLGLLGAAVGLALFFLLLNGFEGA